MTRKNIFLFYEDHYDERVISNSMIRLYMNRFAIDEESAFEIIGVRTLSKPAHLPKFDYENRFQ